MIKSLPWADLMAAGLGRLRLPPHVFWNMTLQELEAALTGAFGQPGRDRMRHTDLASLMERFPDRKGENYG